ncbi:conserved hypothetical protein [Candidatus Protochlamydia naegleriophila]|uniref:GrpB family protein n=2 Tax=Candidatus Protochlamydia naegleriophila TaxID=389348 RepID=A0A0U5JG18_9BACT|nr:conserved hypothetical protein [Candidatus Protochlamydia naegleriophila]
MPYLKNALAIEHVGSTAIPGLGGKGIIDIAVAVKQTDMEAAIPLLQSLGYEFRPTFSTPTRAYFVIFLPDPEETKRRYHLHLTYPESPDWHNLIAFRDHLLNNPQAVQDYAALKQQAALEANHDGEKYRKIKEPMFKAIIRKQENDCR